MNTTKESLGGAIEITIRGDEVLLHMEAEGGEDYATARLTPEQAVTIGARLIQRGNECRDSAGPHPFGRRAGVMESLSCPSCGERQAYDQSHCRFCYEPFSGLTCEQEDDAAAAAAFVFIRLTPAPEP